MSVRLDRLFANRLAEKVRSLLHSALAERDIGESLHEDAPDAPKCVDKALRRRAFWARSGAQSMVSSAGLVDIDRPAR